MSPLHEVPADDYEDLRFAVVMNGGVSLAVWIGGVAQEIHRLQESAGAYAQLLDFTATKAWVDVISGTSAGGINGAFLDLARVYGTDLTPLRDVWLQSGSLDELLRDPWEEDPPSLLRGAHFYDELRKAFQQLKSGTPRVASDVPIDLTLTTTLLHGFPNQLADDFGAPINDANHRGRFTFRRGPDVAHDDFAHPRLADQLALASRATASFPLAFEPVFCRRIPQSAEDGPPMDGVASFAADRYLLDGGILDNKPLDHALNAIFRLRSKGEVRRILCYVVPSPEPVASNHPDDAEKRPLIAEVSVASVATLPLIQSISTQISEIKRHNRSVQRLRQTRLALANLPWESVATSAANLLEVYRCRRAESAAVYITEEIEKGITFEDPGEGFGRRRREWITGLFLEIFRTEGLPSVPESIPPQNARREDLDLHLWHWGLFTVENIADMVLDLLMRGIHLTQLGSSGSDSGERTAYAELKQIQGKVYSLVLDLHKTRESAAGFWRQCGGRFPQPFGNYAAAKSWARESLDLDPDRGKYGDTALSLAQQLAAAAPHLTTVADAANRRNRWPAEGDAANALGKMVGMLTQDSRTPEAVLVRLLTLEVVQFAVGFSGPARDVADHVLELAEIGSDNPALLGLRAVLGHKPAGAKFAHFGGFYKRSWRANDWLLGRLHGVERLVRILLDPERLRRLYFGQTASAVCQELEKIAIPPPSDPDAQACWKWWQRKADLVKKELSFLQDGTQLLPEQLVHAADAVLYRFQLAILRDELPVLAGSIEHDIESRYGPGKGQDFLNEVRRITANRGFLALRSAESEVIERLYRSCRGEEETSSEESITERFLATVTRTFAVGTSMLAGKNAGLGRLSRVTRLIRFPALVTDAIAQSLLRENKTNVAVFAAVISASAATLALAFFTTARIPWQIIGVAAVVLVFTVALFTTRRKHRLKLLALLLLVVVYASSPEVRAVLAKLWTWVEGRLFS